MHLCPECGNSSRTSPCHACGATFLIEKEQMGRPADVAMEVPVPIDLPAAIDFGESQNERAAAVESAAPLPVHLDEAEMDVTTTNPHALQTPRETQGGEIYARYKKLRKIAPWQLVPTGWENPGATIADPPARKK